MMTKRARKTVMLRLGRWFGLLGLGLAATMNAAAAQPVADFYAGKTIILMVGSDVGGGYDTNARLIARHLGKFIPGHPNMIVQNRPGGGSIVAANHIYNLAPKDGTTIGMVQRGMPMAKLTAQPNIQFDPEKFNWLGNLSSEAGIALAWHTTPHQKAEDLLSKELIVGGSGSGAENETVPRLLNAVLGTKFKVISGYKSNTEVLLAVERGELQGVGSMSWPNIKTAKQEEYRQGKIRILLQNALQKERDLPNVPLSLELAKTDADRQALEFYFVQNTIARPIVAPPDMPADRLAALRAAIIAMAKDPAYTEEAAKMGLDVEPIAGEEVQRIVVKLAATPAAVVQRVSDAITVK
jgi:tripartite-type tricarboxylate transporter receptor subunit TctC